MMSEKFFFEKYAGKKKKHDAHLLEDIRAEHDFVHGLIARASLPLSMPFIAQKCAGLLPKNSVAHFAILNAVRNFNFFAIDESVGCFCNTGGFGIDGGVSSLIGSSLIDSETLHFGVFGDLAFFYDMNILGNRHIKSNVRIMIVNNRSGTEMKLRGHPCTLALDDSEIDRYLAAEGHYAGDTLIRDYAVNLGFEYFRAESKDSFNELCPRFFSPSKAGKAFLFEVITKDKDEEAALETLRTLVAAQNKAVPKAPANEGVHCFQEKTPVEVRGENTEEKLRAELDAIKHSLSFRLGRKLTWLPRKIRNFIRRRK